MMTVRSILVGALSVLLLTVGYATASSAGASPVVDDEGLVGAWRSQVQFTSGAFAEVKDLELMYAFNSGGTMTESSNYDGSPPVPPAYGVWRKVAVGQYEARYSFYVTKAPKAFEDIAKGGRLVTRRHRSHRREDSAGGRREDVHVHAASRYLRRDRQAHREWQRSLRSWVPDGLLTGAM